MSITKEKKQEVMSQYAQSTNDTGSAEVQCAIISERIKSLTDHLNENKKDTQAKRGLLMLVAKRRKLLRYLEGVSKSRYQDLIKKLGIRK